MGKPFRTEIDESFATIKWAQNQDTNSLFNSIFRSVNRPLFIVGSGGSLSACYFAACLYQNLGNIAKAVTPLDLYYARHAIKDAKVLFISSSGRNSDILFAFKIAVQNHADDITTICMRKGSPLTKLANSFSVSNAIEYDIPTKKDGFLATNSLTAFFTILAKSSGYIKEIDPNVQVSTLFKQQIQEFVRKLKFDSTIIVLYSGWSAPIAYDIESKFTEAALGCVLLSDYRNFGHGRHHWFAKRADSSVIIALVSKEEELIAKKTIGLIPSNIPCFVMSSEKLGAVASLELLIQSYYLVNFVGEAFKIDPGRPGVPEFGRKLYHLKYESYYKKSYKDKLGIVEEHAILRKAGKSSIDELKPKEMLFWRNKFSEFMNRLGKTKFSSIVLDYDGTLCSPDERYLGCLNENIVAELVKLLEAGIVIGVATGRGQSVRADLRNSKIPVDYWPNLIIGYYNGSDVSSLDDNNCPNIDIEPNLSLTKLENHLKGLIPLLDLDIKLRPNQLTIETSNSSDRKLIKKIIQNIVMTPTFGELQMLESGHSIDVVVILKASKLKVVNHCMEISKRMNQFEDCLTIGDKGQWPGNDYELLSTHFSLSVDEVSPDPDHCWNISSLGVKNVNATLDYLKRISINNGHFMLK